MSPVGMNGQIKEWESRLETDYHTVGFPFMGFFGKSQNRKSPALSIKHI